MKQQLLLIIFFYTFLNLSFAQPPDLKWGKRSGDSWNDKSLSIAVDPNGNSYVTGFFECHLITFGSITLTNSHTGNKNMFIAKYDSTGNVLWAKSLGGECSGESITIDPNENSYVTGYFNSPTFNVGGTILTNPSWVTSSAIFIVKYNTNGSVIWAKSADSDNSEVITSITSDINGNSYIIGSFIGSLMSFGTTTISNFSGYDIFLAKYDSSGNLIWAKSFGDAGHDYGQGVCADSIENVYITGHFGSATFTLGASTLTNPGPALNFFLAKLDSNGNTLWAKAAGGNDEERGSDIVADKNGSCCVIGYSDSPSITFGSLTLTGPGSFLVKYDGTGNELWAKRIISGTTAAGKNITVDVHNNFYISGSWNGTFFILGNDTLTNTYTIIPTYNVFVAKYDPSGNVIWAKSFGGDGDELSSGIGVDSSGNSYTTGPFRGSGFSVGNDTLTCGFPNFDLFVVKIGSNTTPITINELVNTNRITIFPNPFTQKTTISYVLSERSDVQIDVYNIVGQHLKTMLNTSQAANQYSFEFSPEDENCEEGIYFIKTCINGRVNTHKVIYIK